MSAVPRGTALIIRMSTVIGALAGAAPSAARETTP